MKKSFLYLLIFLIGQFSFTQEINDSNEVKQIKNEITNWENLTWDSYIISEDIGETNSRFQYNYIITTLFYLRNDGKNRVYSVTLTDESGKTGTIEHTVSTSRSKELFEKKKREGIEFWSRNLGNQLYKEKEERKQKELKIKLEEEERKQKELEIKLEEEKRKQKELEIKLEEEKRKMKNGISLGKTGGRMRNKSNYMSEVILTLNEYKEVFILDYTNNYFEVCLDSICGYIHEKWIDPNDKVKEFVNQKNPTQTKYNVEDKDLSHYSNIIFSTLKHDEERNLDRIVSYFSKDMKRFYNTYSPKYSDFDMWYSVIGWKNDIKNKYHVKKITRVDKNTFELVCDKEYIYSDKNKPPVKVELKTRYVFDSNDKIIELYWNFTD